MKGFTLKEWIVIIILSLLTALEPLSIDLYLPGFLLISEAFNAEVNAIQISLSTFLAGFAIGQLFWGPLADRIGRKKPILISLFIFIISSVACLYVRTVEQLWIVRFIQAIGGCGGIVISRAVVTDYFDKNRTLKIFSLLALIMGVAPIIAPTIGNGVLQLFSWKGLFGAMAVLGIIMFLLTLFLLPETHKNNLSVTTNNNVLRNYWEILKVGKFTIYAVIAGLANGALMIYVANGPFIIMEKGGFSNTAFGFIFAINAFGLMLGSYITNILQRYITIEKLVNRSLLFMFMMSLVLITLMYFETNIIFILVGLFFYIFPIGILFPATTELAMTPFPDSSGSASALFGSIQLAIAFICSMLSNFMSNGTLVVIGIAFSICCLLGLFVMLFQPKISERVPANMLKEENVHIR